MKVEEQWNINLQIKSKLKVSLPFIMTQRNCLTAAGQVNFHCSLKLFARLWVTLTKSSFRSCELFFYDVAINVIIFLRIEYPFCSRKCNIVEYFVFQRSITTRWIMIHDNPGHELKRKLGLFVHLSRLSSNTRLKDWFLDPGDLRTLI